MDALGNREREIIPRRIAELFVRRNGIMDFCLYTMSFQILLEFISTLTQYREDVPYTIAVGPRNRDSRILHIIYI